jgi:hypothetical protein
MPKAPAGDSGTRCPQPSTVGQVPRWPALLSAQEDRSFLTALAVTVDRDRDRRETSLQSWHIKTPDTARPAARRQNDPGATPEGHRRRTRTALQVRQVR